MILCIETATTNCSVAIFNGTDCVALKEDSASGYSHNEQLHVFINAVCLQAGINLNQLTAIAVSKGPGSYTGLRIGVSAAKGLCYALAIPLIAVETLSVLGRAASGAPTDFIVPMIDARRMEVYSCVLDRNCKPLETADAKVLNRSSFADYLEKGNVTFIGNGVEKWQTVCEHLNAKYIPGALPSAREMGVLANEFFSKKEFVDVAYFEPYYLKNFQTFKKA
jgi:tRNA threonylcarbamoyladenosine biosynthesis protein TsaB